MARYSALAIGTLLFGAATLLFLNEPTWIDRETLAWMGSWRSPALDRLMVAVTHLGSPPATLLLTLSVAGPLFALKRVREGIAVLLSVFGAAVWASVLKEVTRRVRPAEGVLEITSYAFPSWHAAVSAALAASLIFVTIGAVPTRYRPLLFVAALSWPLLIGATRIYLHLHWFSDVLAGWGLGLAWSALVAVVLLERGGARGPA